MAATAAMNMTKASREALLIRAAAACALVAMSVASDVDLIHRPPVWKHANDFFMDGSSARDVYTREKSLAWSLLFIG